MLSEERMTQIAKTVVEQVLALQRRYQCQRWAVEAIQFQEFFQQELIKRAARQGIANSSLHRPQPRRAEPRRRRRCFAGRSH